MDTIQFIIFLATRNVKRYWKRSVQTFAIIFVGALCIMLVDSFMRGFSVSTIDRIVAQSGHLDVHAHGYLDSAEAYPLDIAVAAAEGTERAMLSATLGLTDKGTKAVAAASVSTAGMLSNGETSSAGGVYGTEPFAMDTRGERVVPNPALRQCEDRLLRGRFFDGPGDTGAIIDEKLARKLGLEPGKGVILIGTDSYGSFGMAEIPVIGIVKEGCLPEGAACLTDLSSLQSALGMEGSACSIALWFGKDGPGGFAALGTESEKKAVRSVLSEMADRGLEARPFSAIAAEYSAMFDFLTYFMMGMTLVFALVAGAGMANAILLSVQDRSKDLGTLRAIALSSRGTGLLVMAETFIVGTLASLCAFAMGIIAIWILERTGLSFTFQPGAKNGSGFASTIRPLLGPGRLGVIAIICGVFPIVSAIFPIRVASKLTVREALAA